MSLFSDNQQLLANLHTQVIDCCYRIWSVVSVILCDDSPEGHLPTALHEDIEIDSKRILSYSFRAIHESR